MDSSIIGAGWITPLGTGLDEVWNAILSGAAAPAREITGAPAGRTYFAATIPPKLVDPVARNPRLRRSSNISLFAAAAALAAIRDAGLEPAALRDCAVVFTTSDGGVIYTRKFYDQIVRENAASPLLFPETVYNAPASHIAALLGLDGITYTLAGDSSVGLSGIKLAADLLGSGRAEYCLVIGAEEADWILCEAYRNWRYATAAPGSNRGALVADGAAALLLSRQGRHPIKAITSGVPFFRKTEAAAALGTALRQLPSPLTPDRIISSANGTFIDNAERNALATAGITAESIFPKYQLGDAFGASALIQVVCAIQALRRGSAASVLVPVIGLNHQAAAMAL